MSTIVFDWNLCWSTTNWLHSLKCKVKIMQAKPDFPLQKDLRSTQHSMIAKC